MSEWVDRIRPMAVTVPGLSLRSLVALAAAGSLVGCSSLTSGTSGDEGSVDIVAAKEATENNPAIAKKARMIGGLGQSPSKGKKSSR